jgi:Protein of unknown function (DUF3467)
MADPIPNVTYPLWANTLSPQAPTFRYTNGAAILFSPWDFSLLFTQGVPGSAPSPELASTQAPIAAPLPGPELVARIVMSPQHAKAMLKALGENIAEYEKRYGAIPDIDIQRVREEQEAMLRSQTGQAGGRGRPEDDENREVPEG